MRISGCGGGHVRGNWARRGDTTVSHGSLQELCHATTIRSHLEACTAGCSQRRRLATARGITRSIVTSRAAAAGWELTVRLQSRGEECRPRYRRSRASESHAQRQMQPVTDSDGCGRCGACARKESLRDRKSIRATSPAVTYELRPHNARGSCCEPPGLPSRPTDVTSGADSR